MMDRKWIGRLLVIGMASTLVASAQQRQGISVNGVGEVPVTPSAMVVKVKVSGEAEVAGDAVTKYTAARGRAEKAFKELAIENLTVVGQGPQVDVGVVGGNRGGIVMMGGMGESEMETQVTVSEVLKVTVSKIATVAPGDRAGLASRILDAAKDAGLELIQSQNRMDGMMFFGAGVDPKEPEAVVTFVVDDARADEGGAYQAALEDAKLRATKLAELSGAVLGKVTAIEVQSATHPTGRSANGNTLRIELRVTYAID